MTDAVRIALNLPDVDTGILRELCDRYQATFDEVSPLVFYHASARYGIDNGYSDHYVTNDD